MVLALSWSCQMNDSNNNKSKSITTAITQLVVGLSFGITIIYSLFVLAYSWVVEDNIFNRLVESEAKYIEHRFKKSGVAHSPRSNFMTLHSGWKNVPTEITNQYLEDNNQIEFTLNNNKTMHIKVLNLGSKEYILLADVENIEVSRDYLPNMIFWLIFFSLLCCLLVSFFAIIIARRITSPITRLALAVKEDQGENIEQGFAQNYPNNEVYTLAKVIEEGFIHLKNVLTREINFTKDVSHEIRTPITIVKNIIENNKASQSISKSEFQKISEASYELEKTTQTLLALARNESTHKVNINLTELIENCVLQHFELNHTEKGKALGLDMHLQNDVWIHANQNLVEILLNNLLSNAIYYAIGQQVQISIVKSTLVFSNQFLTPIPENPTKSGHKGETSIGIGQGLNLIERICLINHWSMETSITSQQFKLRINFNP